MDIDHARLTESPADKAGIGLKDLYRYDQGPLEKTSAADWRPFTWGQASGIGHVEFVKIPDDENSDTPMLRELNGRSKDEVTLAKFTTGRDGTGECRVVVGSGTLVDQTAHAEQQQKQ